jgi:replicative DNA helicase
MLQSLADVIEETLDQIQATASGEQASPLTQIVRTGLTELDTVLNGGVRPGQLMVIAARPAAGGSTLARNVALHAAAQQKIPTVLAVPWTTGTDIARRLLSAAARVPVNRLLDGALQDFEWDKLGPAVGLLSGAPLYITAPREQGPEMIERALVEAAAHGRRTGFVVVDSFAAMVPPTLRSDRPSVVARELKRLALDRGVAVLVTVGLTAPPETRSNALPLISDLRGTGDLDDVADVVVLLHRDDLTNMCSPRPGEADLVVAKNANGPTRTLTVAFQGHYSRFVDMVAQHHSGGAAVAPQTR